MMNIPHSRLTYSEKEVSAVSAVIRSGQWAGGPQVRRLEQEVCTLFKAPAAVCVGSGLAALRLALKALNVEKGDEVIVPAYSCVALPNAVLAVGAIPVAADVCEGSWAIDAVDAARRRTGKTKAIIAVNTYGYPADIELLKAKTGLRIIEDSSHGFSCQLGSPAPFSVADIAILSFYATKLIAAGEGGVLLACESRIAEFVGDMRDYTDKLPEAGRLNDKMTDIEATLALCQLDRLEDMLRARRARAEIYSRALAGIPGITLPRDAADRVWYRYALQVPPRRLMSLSEDLGKKGVTACRPVEPWLATEELATYPVAARAYETLLSLPLYPTLSEIEHEHVIANMKTAAGKWKTGL